MPDEKLSLVAKLAEVMDVVKRIPKAGWNDHFRYHFARESDVVDAIRVELAQRKVFITCAVETVKQSDAGTTKSGNPKTRTVVECVFTIRDGDSNEAIALPFKNEAIDDQDKGVNKALTAARKYFLLNNFLVPTGDDLDQEAPKEGSARTTNQSRERPTSQPRPAPAGTAGTAASATGTTSAPRPTAGNPPAPKPDAGPAEGPGTFRAASALTAPATEPPVEQPSAPGNPAPPAPVAPAPPSTPQSTTLKMRCNDCQKPIPAMLPMAKLVERKTRFGVELCESCVGKREERGAA